MTRAKRRVFPQIEIGQTFGSLTVLSVQSEIINGTRYKTASCQCECGKTTRSLQTNLNGGLAKSCGCARKKSLKAGGKNLRHGHTLTAKDKSPTYSSWTSMKTRCLNTKANCYPGYGGRGITICQQWIDSFAQFLKDMGPRPSMRHTLERWNNKGNYTPDNCLWADWEHQARNRSNTLFVTLNGETGNFSDLADMVPLKNKTIYKRIHKYGWSVEAAFSKPVRGSKRAA